MPIETYQKQPGIAEVVIDHPPVNALDVAGWFALAEADLRVRGEGTLLGARQKGQSDLRLASLADPGDMALLDEARQVAESMVAEDPQLEAHADLADEVRLLLSEDEGEYLFKS